MVRSVTMVEDGCHPHLRSSPSRGKENKGEGVLDAGFAGIGLYDQDLRPAQAGIGERGGGRPISDLRMIQPALQVIIQKPFPVCHRNFPES